MGLGADDDMLYRKVEELEDRTDEQLGKGLEHTNKAVSKLESEIHRASNRAYQYNLDLQNRIDKLIHEVKCDFQREHDRTQERLNERFDNIWFLRKPKWLIKHQAKQRQADEMEYESTRYDNEYND